MKTIKTIFAAIFLAVIFLPVQIYSQQDTTASKIKETKEKLHQSRMFVDENGDGYNDNAPDHDGDGIPNGLDPDYQKFSKKRKFENLPYVDLDGDGINDNLQKYNKLKGHGLNNPNGLAPQHGNNQSTGNNSNKGQGNQKGKGAKK
ncbi:MAG: hypothetical protein KJ571_04395 [Bacteroidetes bacterium]|nr:hypothetical protein [Bacteroidota bacterium]